MNTTGTTPGMSKDQTIVDYLRDNWAFLGSVGYLYLTCVGMALSWSLYNSYGINIFEFAELNDFLLAAFREPITILSGIIVGLYSIPLYVLLRKRNSRFAVIAKRWFPVTVVIVSLAAPVIMNFQMSQRRDFGRMLWERQVNFSLRRGSLYSESVSPTTSDFYLIGASDKFVFLLDGSTETAVVVPVSNLVSISLTRKRGELKRVNELSRLLNEMLDNRTLTGEEIVSRMVEKGAPSLWVKSRVKHAKLPSVPVNSEKKVPNKPNKANATDAKSRAAD